MAKQFDTISDDHAAFIAAQHVFFCGTAAADGRVNISPKGMDSLRVLGPNRIIWRNLTGSGTRDVLEHWTNDRGPDGIATYWETRNQQTIDGLPTHILDDSNV